MTYVVYCQRTTQRAAHVYWIRVRKRSSTHGQCTNRTQKCLHWRFYDTALRILKVSLCIFQATAIWNLLELVQIHHTRVIVLWPLFRQDSLKRLQVRLLGLRQHSFCKRVSRCLVDLTPVNAFLPLCGNAKGNIFLKSCFQQPPQLLILVAIGELPCLNNLLARDESLSFRWVHGVSL